MRLLVLCSLALAAWACVGVRAQEDDPDQLTSCFPCRDEDRATSNCTAVRPEQCSSGKLYTCGCCDTCQINLTEGSICYGFVETNGVCNRPMYCEGNICRSP